MSNLFLSDKKTNKKRKPVRVRSGGIVALVVIVTLLLCVFLVMILPAFRILEINVSGNQIIKTEDILSTISVRRGDNVFLAVSGGLKRVISLRYGSVEDILSENYPYIKTVTVRAVIPSEVNIVIEERKKIGYLDVPDGYAVIDMDGYVIGLFGETAPKGIPVIEGIPVNTAVLGKKLTLSNDEGFNRALLIFGAILSADDANSDGSGYDLMSCIDTVRYVGDNTVYLDVSPMKSSKSIIIKIGNLKNIHDDMIWLRTALAKDMIDYSEPRVLDMSGEEFTLKMND